MAELDAHNAASYRFYVDGTAAPELTAEDGAPGARRRPWALHLGTLGLVFEPIATSLETLVEALPADDVADARPERPPIGDARPGGMAVAGRAYRGAGVDRPGDHR